MRTSKADRARIEKVAHRAVAAGANAEVHVNWFSVFLAVSMVHARTPLALQELLEADDFNFNHDVFGILRHIDGHSGELRDCFVPRFSASNRKDKKFAQRATAIQGKP